MNDNFADELMAVSLWLEAARGECRIEPRPSKRSTMRYAWNGPMEMKDRENVHYVHCYDIGAGGLGIISRRAVVPEATVLLRHSTNDPWVACSVAHCTETVGKFRIGMKVKLDL
ncbi:MAG: PilZ domain-containing protein [Phycisphaerales bacterium]|nr:PilZ domain-containing protein [Phycisphaerales bacterium]